MTTPKGYQRIEGSQRSPAYGARRVGDADSKETLSVTICVRRRQDAKPLPDPLAAASGPLGEQKFLSREAFAEQFGAAPADLKLVEEFGRGHGLAVVESSAAKRMVVLSGTVAQMSRAFGVTLGRYKSPTETYRGREGHVHVPKKLGNIIEGVFGLDNRRMARRAAIRAGTSLLTPPQVAKLYNFPNTNNGSGQTIGILEFGGGYKKADIDAFFAGLGLATPALTDVGVLGATNSPGSDADGEVVLDIDVSGGVAPGAHLAVYFAPWTEQGWVNAIADAVHDTTNKPSVLSLSWGYPEGKGVDGVTWTQAAINAVNAKLGEATQLGVTVFAATGDWGSSSGFSGGKALVWYPCTDPNVTACGGTTIRNVSGTSFTETTWPDTGGGISDVFPLPVWQQGIGIPGSANDGHTGRGIPDVAGNADPASGYLLTLNGGHIGVGGTSAVSPLYAGLMALINASLPNPAGWLNPRLYSYGKNPSLHVFRDIADSVSNASYGAPGYTAGPGWDACTGWGSINGNALLTALNPPIVVCGPLCHPVVVVCLPTKVCAPNIVCAPKLCLPKHVCLPFFGCLPEEIYVQACGPVMKVITPETLVSDPELQKQIETVRQDIAQLKERVAKRG